MPSADKEDFISNNEKKHEKKFLPQSEKFFSKIHVTPNPAKILFSESRYFGLSLLHVGAQMSLKLAICL